MKVSEIGPRYHVSKTLSLKPKNTVFLITSNPIPDRIPDNIINFFAGKYWSGGALRLCSRISSYGPDTTEAHFKKKGILLLT